MLNFNLEAPSFSDEDEEEEQLPSGQLMQQYNREYSLILAEVQSFLKECKDSVQRFVTLHNFGANFNLAHLLTSLHLVDQAIATKTALPAEDPRSAAKRNYELSFNRLLQRMASLLADILDCELEFKQKYFGFSASPAPPRPRPHLAPARSVHASSIKTLSKSSSSSVRQWRDDREEEREAAREAEREAELRSTLNERLKLRMPKVETECKAEFSTTENLYRLNEKIERMVGDMKASREREKKLIELFTLNRTKTLPHPDPPAPTPTPTSASASAPTCASDHEEVDQYLDSCRRFRKDSDSYSEANHEARNFSKKQNQLQRE